MAEEGRRSQETDNIRLLFMQIVYFFPNLKLLCCSCLSAHSMSCVLSMHTAPLLKREFFYPSSGLKWCQNNVSQNKCHGL